MKNLQTELTPAQISYLHRAILHHFKNNARFDRNAKMVQCKDLFELNEYLGLAYTSSSSFAMYSICNEEVYLDEQRKYHYICFGMDENGFCVALCYDKDENELYINI